MSIPVAMVSVGLLVFAAHLFAVIFQRFRLPDTVWLITIGILLGPVFHVLKPEDFGVVGGIFTTIALVVILFEAGLDLSFNDLRKSFASTMRITLGCYVLTTIIITLTVHYWGGYEWMTSIFVGAVLAGPSPPVIIPMAKSLNLREHNRVLLTLESALGEAICLVIALAILRFSRMGSSATEDGAQSGGVDFASSTGTLGEIIAAFIIAVIIGIVGGILWALMLEKVRQLKNTISTTLSFVFIVYGLCEMLNYSGPVAALLFGITIGNIQMFRNMPIFEGGSGWQMTNHSATEVMFFSEIVFLLKTFFFVFLGLSMGLDDLTAPIAVGLIGMLLLARLLAVKVTLNKEVHIAKEGLFLGVMIPKGLAAAVLGSLAAHSGLPGGDDAENLIYAVILYSILASAILVFLIDKAHIHLGFVWLFPTREEDEEQPNGKTEKTDKSGVSEEPALTGGEPEESESKPVPGSGEDDEESGPGPHNPEAESEPVKKAGQMKPAGGSEENEKRVRQSIEEGLQEARGGKPQAEAKPPAQATETTGGQDDGEEHEIHRHPDRSLADLTLAGEEHEPRRTKESQQDDLPELGTGGSDSKKDS